MAIHYSSMTENKKIAGFSFSNFPTIDADGNAKICDLFIVYIDLETKCMVEAKLDDMALTADEALILCWFNTIASNHVKLHALENCIGGLTMKLKPGNTVLLLLVHHLLQ